MSNQEYANNEDLEVSQERSYGGDRGHEDNNGAPSGQGGSFRDDTEETQGKIFIGGLSWSTTEQTLRYYFEKYGELADVALMMDKHTGKPRGFGFIRMKDPAAADVIMSNDHTIDGRLVDVKRALPRDKAPGPARSESCKIFVGGLSMDVTEKEFGDYFNKFGPVKDAVVMVDRNTGSSRGFGFVTFETEDVVQKVLKMDHELHGKFIEIKRAEPRESSYGGGGGRGFGGRGGGGYGGGGGYDQGGYGGGGRGGYGGGRGGGGGRGYGGGGRGGGGGGDMYPPAGGYGAYMGMGGRGYPAAYPGYPRAPFPMPYGYPPMAAGYGAPGYPATGGYAAYGSAANPQGGGAAGAGGPGGAPNPYGGAAPNYPGGAGGPGGDNKGGNDQPNPMAGGGGYPRPAYGYGGAMPYGYGYPMANPAGGPPGPAGKPPGGNDGEGAAGPGGYGAYRGVAGSQGRADRGYRPY